MSFLQDPGVGTRLPPSTSLNTLPLSSEASLSLYSPLAVFVTSTSTQIKKAKAVRWVRCATWYRPPKPSTVVACDRESTCLSSQSSVVTTTLLPSAISSTLLLGPIVEDCGAELL